MWQVHGTRRTYLVRSPPSTWWSHVPGTRYCTHYVTFFVTCFFFSSSCISKKHYYLGPVAASIFFLRHIRRHVKSLRTYHIVGKYNWHLCIKIKYEPSLHFRTNGTYHDLPGTQGCFLYRIEYGSFVITVDFFHIVTASLGIYSVISRTAGSVRAYVYTCYRGVSSRGGAVNDSLWLLSVVFLSYVTMSLGNFASSHLTMVNPHLAQHNTKQAQYTRDQFSKRSVSTTTNTTTSYHLHSEAATHRDHHQYLQLKAWRPPSNAKRSTRKSWAGRSTWWSPSL